MLEGLDIEAGLDRVFELARAEGGTAAGRGQPWMRERFDLYSRTVTAVESYVPRPYGGRVILFRARRCYRSGYYSRDLVTRVGRLELRVPQDRQGRFSTQVFERYQRSEAGAVGNVHPRCVDT